VTALVADVGGTNSRLALVTGQGALARTARFRNDDFASLYDVIAAFLAEGDGPDIRACCIAVAGPVSAAHARLTNRDWTIEAARVSSLLPGGKVPVRIVNDLAALGSSLAGLAGEQVEIIRLATGPADGNGQSLVAGFGTGFNVCLAREGVPGPVALEAELGHASLPVTVQAALAAAVGAKAERFSTVEGLFAGRGISRLHAALTGEEDRPAHEIAADPAAGQTLRIAGRLMGHLAREMVFQYMPREGLYLAGSVARGLLTPPARAELIAAFAADGPFADLVRSVPLRLITDDSAALTGLARLALAEAGHSGN